MKQAAQLDLSATGNFQRLIPRILLLACIYILVAQIGLFFTTQADLISPVWPLSGIMFAAILRGGLRLWPAIFLGELLTGLWIGIPLGIELGIATMTTLEAVVGVIVLRQFAGFSLELDSFREVLAFIVVTTLFNVPLAATGVAFLLTITQQADWSYTWHIWRAWWIGDVMGILTVTPMTLALQHVRWRSLRWRAIGERLILYSLLIIATRAIMQGFFNYSYVLLVFVIWSALRFGPRGTAFTMTIICTIAVWMTTLGEGPFVISVLGENLFFLQTFLLTITITGLIVSALVAERTRSLQVTQLMADVSVDVMQSQDESRMLEAVAERLAGWAGGCSIALLETDGQLNTVATQSTETGYKQLIDSWKQTGMPADLHDPAFLAISLQKQQPILLLRDMPQKHEKLAQTQAYHRLSDILHQHMLILAPMIMYNYPLGIMMLFSAEPSRIYQPADLACVQEIADRITLALTTTRLSADMARLQKLDSLGHLANSVAHDFNNMLTAILGHSEMALYLLEKEHPAYLDLNSIMSAAKTAQLLVGELRTIGYNGPALPQPMSLNLIIQQVDILLRSLIRSPIEIVYELTPDLGLCSIDPTQIERVIVNLATNARDAMLTGGTITIRTCTITIDSATLTRADIQPGRYSCVSVQDTGSGIAPEIMKRIFEPYFTTKARGTGSGLGLAISYGIIRRFNGTITAQSEPGYGALFTIYLPEISD